MGWTTNDPADVLAAAADVRAAWLTPPSWHERASCRGAGTAGFVTPVRGRWKVDVCADCPVRRQCALAALAILDSGGAPIGCWAGVVTRDLSRRRGTRERLQQVAGATV